MDYTKIISDLIRNSIKPPQKLSLSEFAEARYRLSSDNSPEPGRYVIARAEYQRLMLDSITDPKYQEIVFCLGSQTGKTTISLITLMYFMSVDPSPVLFVCPSEAMARTVSKDRLNPALRDCIGFDTILKENTGKTSSNNILNKSFPGGSLNIVGSGSASQLASRPIRICILDEVDRFDSDAGGEGHAAALAAKRTANFYNRKIVTNATPTDLETSYVWAKFQASNQSYFHIKCQHCGEHWVPEWDHVKWSKDENGDHLPETALLHCQHCGSGHTDAQRNQAVRQGHWVKTYPEREIAGFHVSALHSPWSVLSKLVVEWITAQGNVGLLKVFKNTVCALPWEEAAQKLDDINLAARATDISADNIPDDVSVLTIGADTQNDRFEAVLLGHGSEGRKYILDHKVIHGDPATALPQQQLKDYILKTYTRNDGAQLKVMATVVDSGGSATAAIYKFTSDNRKYRVYAGKGRDGNLPIFPSRASTTEKGRLYIIGVDSAKDMIYSHLKIDDPEAAGYIHLSETLTPDFLEQLTSEKKVLKNRHGYSYWRWVLPSGRRNEALDIFAYALAAYESLGGADANYFAKKINKAKMRQTVPDAPQPAPSDPIQIQIPQPQEQQEKQPVPIQKKKPKFTRAVSSWV